ncbi:hypothetical protein [Thiococcus pfennigii]|uniref:hypothetical protein n=1 Tax=Thiococcus pfennigii TaxID=1057 RepID=UPI001902D175|nr:hypothetical protein [Thiococcus pfennigii]MBK1732897.1 hypothetical protein [Thiococcus pfennigii]
MCQCISTVNARLREQDLCLVLVQPLGKDLALRPPRVALRTARPSGRRKPMPDLSAAFCPFCGARCAEADDAATDPR